MMAHCTVHAQLKSVYGILGSRAIAISMSKVRGPGVEATPHPQPSILRGPDMRKKSCYVILDQRGCVHGDASFHHDIVPECLWPSSEYSSSETDGRIAS